MNPYDSIEPTEHFAPDYARARAAFLRAAEARKAEVASRPISARGPAGEELAVDTAYVGPHSPATLVVVTCGIHGVEGFAGSAIQHRLLSRQLDGLALEPDTGLLAVHALNPYGFAHLRRVNESNVDLNRNFLAHPDEHVANPDYELLFDAVNPSTLDEESERLNNGAIFAFAQEHGFSRLQEALSRGQYTHADGVYFGGDREEESNRIVRDIVRDELRGAARVGWLDFHTGLGDYGEVELISEVPADDPAYVRGRAWYGDLQRSTFEGDSVSSHLTGTVDQGVPRMLDAGVELTIHAPEFGTYDPARVFRAIRADNWLVHHGEVESEQGRAIKAELLEVFRPADPAWQARILGTGAEMIGRLVEGLRGSEPAAR